MPEIGRFIMKHYLDVPMILRISRYLRDPKSKKQIAEAKGMGQPKVRGLLEWGRHLAVIELREDDTYMVTSLGRSIDEIGSRYLYEILYWKLVKGHRAVQTIVNDFLYSKSRSFSPEFSYEELKRFLQQRSSFLGNPTEGDLKSIYLESLNALSKQLKGFGTLGMVVPLSGQTETFRINSYRPDWRTAAYILYDSWPENTSRVRIKEVVSGQNSLGRIFFLTEPQVMALLSKLEQERALALEVIADLRQIGPNPSMTAEDFLEMLIHD